MSSAVPAAAARWGGMYAPPLTKTTAAAQCEICGSASGLRLDGDRFVCRDETVCRAVTENRAARSRLLDDLARYLRALART